MDLIKPYTRSLSVCMKTPSYEGEGALEGRGPSLLIRHNPNRHTLTPVFPINGAEYTAQYMDAWEEYGGLDGWPCMQ